MTDLVLWLLVLEAIGLAALPLTIRMFRTLPDRGYGFSRVVGLVLLTYITWLAGSIVPIAGSPLLPAIILVVAAATTWSLFGRETAGAVRGVGRIALLEELLFLAAFAAWALLRSNFFHPGIGHTEQYMDLTLFTASGRAASYPPYDPWMSGHTINYYYVGYLMYSMVGKLAGVAPAVGYNLALVSVFALTISGCFGIGFAATRRLAASLVFPGFVVLLGNWYALADALSRHSLNGAGWFWNSTRVVDPPSNTINEFPLFSFMLGDLHPHVMALPVALLAVAFAAAIALDSDVLGWNVPSALRLLPAAITAGALFTLNSWDFPTYFLVIAGGIGVHAYLADNTPDWWQRPLLLCVALGAASLLLFAPFYIHFRSLAHGLGEVTTPTNIGQFVEVFGMFSVCVAILLALFGWLLQPEAADEAATSEEIPSHRVTEAGAVRIFDPSYLVLAFLVLVACVVAARYGLWTALLVGAFTAAVGISLPRVINVARPATVDTVTLVLLCLVGVVTLGLHLQMWTLLLVLSGGLYAAAMLHRVLNTEDPSRADAIALILIGAGCLVLALTETVYVRDAFDGGSLYRMNTVFKFYYQAWILLGLAAAYAGVRVVSLFREGMLPWVLRGGLALVVLAALGGALYTWKAPESYAAYQVGSQTGLDGMAWFAAAHPADATAIDWLRSHTNGNPVVLEAVGNDYTPDAARVSTFSGLPTVMGWIGHEQQWRNGDPTIAVRSADVTTIYTTHSIATARALLEKYQVKYVFVGDSERALPHASLQKFRAFLRVAFRSQNTLIYTW